MAKFYLHFLFSWYVFYFINIILTIFLVVILLLCWFYKQPAQLGLGVIISSCLLYSVVNRFNKVQHYIYKILLRYFFTPELKYCTIYWPRGQNIGGQNIVSHQPMKCQSSFTSCATAHLREISTLYKFRLYHKGHYKPLTLKCILNG